MTLYSIANVFWFLKNMQMDGSGPHIVARAFAASEACGMPGRGFMSGDVDDIMCGDVNLAKWFEGAATSDPSHIEIGIAALRGAHVRFDPVDVLITLFGVKEATSFITKMVEGREDTFPDRQALVEAIDARLIEMGVAWKHGYADTLVGKWQVRKLGSSGEEEKEQPKDDATGDE